MTSTAPKPAAHRGCRPSAQGMALLEALVASAVLGMGLAVAVRLTLHALQTASDTRQHTVAHVLAVSAMECHISARASCELTQEVTVQGTRYSLQSQLRPRAGWALVDIEVRIQWPAVSPVQTSSATEATAQRIGQLVLHSSRDQVPAWVGVSLP